MNGDTRFSEIARGVARLRDRTPSEAPSPQSSVHDVASADAPPAAGKPSLRCAGGRSSSRQYQEILRAMPKEKLAANRASVRADLEKIRRAKEANIPVGEMFPDDEFNFEQMELIPPDEQQLPERHLRNVAGLPDPSTLYYSAAREA